LKPNWTYRENMQDKKSPYDLIVITGPTATGKTRLAAELADAMKAEVISADSRQVYKGMDIGTGKDLADYVVGGRDVPVHLVDMVKPGYEYNVFEFQDNFLKTFQSIRQRNRQAIMCGGTGLYIEAALAKYHLLKVPVNNKLRDQLGDLTQDELVQKLASMKTLHNTTDLTDRKRLIRAIEIETYNADHSDERKDFPGFSHIIFGVSFPRKIIRERITSRLKHRLENGMLKEVEQLLKAGLKPQQLTFYGLEYRYVTQYITGDINYDEMFNLLNTAIHQFAKRQMTWFRRMERNGFKIHWIDGSLNNEQKLKYIFNTLWK
jgi:tRNA dimethylallyltransferase